MLRILSALASCCAIGAAAIAAAFIAPGPAPVPDEATRALFLLPDAFRHDIDAVVRRYDLTAASLAGVAIKPDDDVLAREFPYAYYESWTELVATILGESRVGLDSARSADTASPTRQVDMIDSVTSTDSSPQSGDIGAEAASFSNALPSLSAGASSGTLLNTTVSPDVPQSSLGRVGPATLPRPASPTSPAEPSSMTTPPGGFAVAEPPSFGLMLAGLLALAAARRRQRSH